MIGRTVVSLMGAALLVCAYGCSEDENENPVAPDPNPTVAITSPTSGAHVGDVLLVEADATDDKGVAFVQFYLDGGIAAADYVPPYATHLSTRYFSHLSEHSVFAVAYDTDDHKTGSVPVFVRIDTMVSLPDPVVLQDPPVMTFVHLWIDL
jgi:hypothetical protein